MFGFGKKNGVICAPIIPTIPKDSEKMTFTHTKDTEEWIWVDGYKGTDKDMKCRDYQFELGKQFDISDDQKVELCKHGFHFCKELKDVYDYYALCGNHRFFKVRALVRKEDYDSYGNHVFDMVRGRVEVNDKLVAKSIVFERELTTDEIVAVTKFKDEDAEFKEAVRVEGIRWGYHEREIRKLVAVRYCREMAELVTDRGINCLAIALAKQEGISWDTRITLLSQKLA